MLFLLAERGLPSPVAITDTPTIERAHLGALRDRLQALGLVERRAGPADRQRHAVLLTDAGTATSRQIGALAGEGEEELLGDPTPAEPVTFRGTLRRLARDADE